MECKTPSEGDHKAPATYRLAVALMELLPNNRSYLHKISRAIWSPHVHPAFLRIPHSRFIACIIPDLLQVTHEFDQIPLWVAEVFKLVLAGAVPSGTIQQYVAIVHQV